MLRMVVAFAPWIAYWVLSDRGLVTVAAGAGLAGALLLNLYRLRAGRPKLMDVLTLGFFTLHFLFTVILRSGIFRAYEGVLVYLALAGMAWGSLAAGSPFTYQYARDDWPPEYRDNPLFRQTNVIITLVWAAIFTLNLGSNLLALVLPAQRLLLETILPNALLIPGIAFSILFPRWFPRRALARDIARTYHAYGWPPPAFPAERPSGPDNFDVIVIGAGIGGLTAAALLARRGLRVLVVEQAHYAGGFCASFRRRRHYVFDMGVHDISGLGPHGPVRLLLRQLGLEDRLEFARVQHEYILSDLRLRVPEKVNQLVDLLGDLFPAEREGIRTFFAEMEGVYRELYDDVEHTGGVPRPPAGVEDMLRFPVTHPRVYRWMNRGYLEMLDAFVGNRHLKEILCCLTGYQTDRPEQLTALHMAPIFGYYFDGGYYPRGGSGALSGALAEAVREHGGEILLKRKVVRILVEEGTARGVRLEDGAVFRAQAVISNADLGQTFLHLVGAEHLPPDFVSRVRALRPSPSVFMVFLGLDYEPPIAPVTVYRPAGGPGLGLMVPSKVDPSLAPPGHHVLTLMTLVPQPEAAAWSREAPGYQERKAAFAGNLLDQAEGILPGLRDHVVTMDAATPSTVTRYTLHPGGAIYGPALTGPRWPHQTPVRNLYLAGAGSWPGAGVEAVVISGVCTADAIYPNP